MDFKRLLIATDLSSHSEATIRYVRAIVDDSHDITLLTVVADCRVPMFAGMSSASPIIEQFRNESTAKATTLLDDMCERVLKPLCASKITLPSSASPAHVITSYASENKFDVIAIGSHGAGRLSNLFIGTMAQRILRLASCPVLVIPEKAVAEAPRPARKLLVATDLSEGSFRLLETVPRYLKAKQVTLLSVQKSFGDPHSRNDDYSEIYSSLAAHMQRGVECVRRQLEDVAALSFEGCNVDVKVVETSSTVAEAIIEQAAITGADRIVMGSHGEGMLENLFIGSTLLDVLKRAALPVLVIPVARSIGST